MTAYGSLQFWEDRYSKDVDYFDWFQRYPALKPLLLEIGLKPESQILMLGCGVSRMSEELYDDGFKNITNIDYAASCIKSMQERTAGKDEMTWHVMNVLDMSELPQEKFDIIIDKGTLDCILCGDQSFDNAKKMMAQVRRILAKNGTYVVVSYGQPAFRMMHLQRPEWNWTVGVKSLQKPQLNTSFGVEEKDNVHYIYLCKKHAEGEAKPADGPAVETPEQEAPKE